MVFHYRDEIALETQLLLDRLPVPAGAGAGGAYVAVASSWTEAKENKKGAGGASSSGAGAASSSGSQPLVGAKRKAPSSSGAASPLKTVSLMDLASAGGQFAADECVVVKVAPGGGKQNDAIEVMIPVLRASKLGFKEDKDGALILDDSSDEDDAGGKKGGKKGAKKAKRAKRDKDDDGDEEEVEEGSNGLKPAPWFTLNHLLAGIKAALDEQDDDKDTRVVSLDGARALASAAFKPDPSSNSSAAGAGAGANTNGRVARLKKAAADGRLFNADGKAVTTVEEAIEQGSKVLLVVLFNGKAAAFKPLADLKPDDAL